jgi:hypothetical protein
VVSIKLTDPTLEFLLHKLYNTFSVIMSLYILEYDYDKLCWHDTFHMFKENECLKENEFQRKMRYDYMSYVKSL